MTDQSVEPLAWKSERELIGFLLYCLSSGESLNDADNARIDVFLAKHAPASPQPQLGKYPIDRPCSACSAGDSEMKYRDHDPPFRAIEVAMSEQPCKLTRSIFINTIERAIRLTIRACGMSLHEAHVAARIVELLKAEAQHGK